MSRTFHAYCITPRDVAVPPKVTGIDGIEVDAISDHALTLLFSQHDTPLEHTNTDHMIAHGEVVEQVFEHSNVLPLRYGIQFESRADMEKALDENSSAWLQQLGRIEGAVEIGVRLLSAHTDSQNHNGGDQKQQDDRNQSGGRSFLEQRAKHYEQEDALSDRAGLIFPALIRELGSLCKEHQISRGELAGMHSELLSLLVRRNSLDQVSEAIIKKVDGVDNVSVSGPWPAWSFSQPDQEVSSDAHGT